MPWMYASVGKAVDSSRLFKAYGAVYSKGLPDGLAGKRDVADDRWNALPPDISFWGIALYALDDRS